MRVHLIKEITVTEYARFNIQSSASLFEWVRKLDRADWLIPEDIRRNYPTVDYLGGGTNRVVFDPSTTLRTSIGGNKYRMICTYLFGETYVHLFVKWIGSHSEYTKLCKSNKQYTISVY